MPTATTERVTADQLAELRRMMPDAPADAFADLTKAQAECVILMDLPHYGVMVK